MNKCMIYGTIKFNNIFYDYSVYIYSLITLQILKGEKWNTYLKTKSF